tara:strand:+ start:1515 stop:1724 length:210 start_codon:yes stop_codon:yes gene_type:complete
MVVHPCTYIGENVLRFHGKRRRLCEMKKGLEDPISGKVVDIGIEVVLAQSENADEERPMVFEHCGYHSE